MPEEADNGIGEAIIGLTGSDVGWLSSSRKAEKEEEKAKEKEIFGESKRKAKLATSNSCGFAAFFRPVSCWRGGGVPWRECFPHDQ